MRTAVFTKNLANPAYEAARLGADRTAAQLGATTAHDAPKLPGRAPEQIALMHETAANEAILRFDAAGTPIPGCEMKVLPGAGHACQIEQPWLFNRLMIEFLTGHGLFPSPH